MNPIRLLLLLMFSSLSLHLSAANLDEELRAAIISGVNPGMKVAEFKEQFKLAMGREAGEVTQPPSNSFLEYLVYSDDHVFHSKVVHYEIKDLREMMVWILEAVWKGVYPYSFSDVQQLRVVIHKEGKQPYFVGECQLFGTVRPKLFFVMNEQRELLYLGVKNRYTNLLSASLPVYSKGEGDALPFEEFDVDVGQLLEKGPLLQAQDAKP